MKTITFYSYKGGTGRSLALANAARYLAGLDFRVVALDFDLEAPGLHYKFSTDTDGRPLPVRAGVADYIHGFIAEGRIPESLKDFTINVSVPGADKPVVKLIPAGEVPSKEYWSKLSRINWHDLFYSKEAKGVHLFLELKSRILDELEPDFLLIDARTGITEMGGVATTLMADKVICLVLPTRENLEGARAVLRSLRRSRRESGVGDLEITVAVSRLPQMKDSEAEREVTNRILTVLNEEAEDLKDTLSCSEVFILHSEAGLEIRETLRVGSGISPDESILLRDYLRLFANVVPKVLIEPKIGQLIRQARERIWEDPEGATKEMEELAESFGHPEIYRALLSFYEVRNVSGASVLKRAQRLWELTGDSTDAKLWQLLRKHFEPKPRWRGKREWFPDLDFAEAVWRDAGMKDPEFGLKLAEAYQYEDRESRGADVLLGIINAYDANSAIASRCIALLDASNRTTEAEALIQQLKPKLRAEPDFVVAWARHAIRGKSKEALLELIQPQVADLLQPLDPALAARVYIKAGLPEEATVMADQALRELADRDRPVALHISYDVADLFHELGRWEEFEKTVKGRIPAEVLENLRERSTRRRRGLP